MSDAFSNESIEFLAGLRKNNDREWFESHKDQFRAHIEKPAKAFMQALGEELGAVVGGGVSGKIFRFYRDVRFSKDKTPYNTHVRMAFSAVESGGADCKTERSKFYFSLEPETLTLGTGTMEMSKDLLVRFREAVDDENRGSELAGILDALSKSGARVREPELKRVPGGFEPDHPRESLLRCKALSAWFKGPHPPQLFGEHAAEYCAAELQKLLPVYRWLEAL